MNEDIVVVDDGKTYESQESAIIAKDEADRAEKWAKEAEKQANLSADSAANAKASELAAAQSAQDAADTVLGFDQHAEEAKNNFDRNYNDKLVAFNINAIDKQNDFDVNAATLTARYDNNDLAKTEAFNKNAQDMTDGFNTNAMLKVDDFDAHAKVKEIEFDDNASQKISDFNNNAIQKTSDFDKNATEKQSLVDVSAEKAKQSELNAATSEANAKASELNAKNSENASGISEDNARESERLAREHMEAAQLSETNAKTSEDNAAMSASDAELSAQASALSEQSAKDSAEKAANSVIGIDEDVLRAETAASNAEKFANGTIEEYPEGSSKYWRDQAQAIVGSGQMLLDVDQEVNSSKTFLKDQAIKSPNLDIRNDRSKRGNGLIFTDKNGTQTAGIGVYINNNQSPECRFVASNGNKSAFAGLGVTTDGQGFFEIPEPSDTSDNNDAVSSRWVNKKVNTKQDKLSTAQITATNSGITSAKVATYDGYNATISGKQAQLNATQLNAVNSGITLAKVSTYDGYKSLIDGKQPAGSYQTVGNLSQTLDASASKYPSNKAVATAIANIDALPTQTGQAGKFLSTDGTSAKWEETGGKDQNTGKPLYDWVGTTAEYEAQNVATSHPDWLCYITDDTDATSIADFMNTVYPVGSMFFATAETCPLQALGIGAWNKVGSSLVLSVNSSAGVKGNGKTIGITSGKENAGLFGSNYDNGRISNRVALYGTDVGKRAAGGANIGANDPTIGITTDASKSGMVADITRTQINVNVFKRVA